MKTKIFFLFTLLLFLNSSCTPDIQKIEKETQTEVTKTVQKDSVSNSETKRTLESVLESVPKEYRQRQNLVDEVFYTIESQLTNIVYQDAQDKGDVSICGNLKAFASFGNCKYSFYISKALKNQDPLVCSKLEGEQKENCEKTVYTQLARQKKDITFCDKIEGNGEKTSEKKICKNVVYTEKALSEKKIGVCSQITDELERDFCEDMVELKIEEIELELEINE